MYTCAVLMHACSCYQVFDFRLNSMFPPEQAEVVSYGGQVWRMHEGNGVTH